MGLAAAVKKGPENGDVDIDLARRVDLHGPSAGASPPRAGRVAPQAVEGSEIRLWDGLP